jgi:hypothetical protein
MNFSCKCRRWSTTVLLVLFMLLLTTAVLVRARALLNLEAIEAIPFDAPDTLDALGWNSCSRRQVVHLRLQELCGVCSNR